MKFYGNVYLYKTPLDPDYKNVYDSYNSIGQYIDLLNNFPFTVIRNMIDVTPKDASRKNVGDTFDVVISGSNFMEVHDYNYMMFKLDANTYEFAFILYAESMNDGLTSKSAKLHCKLDAWTNNYLSSIKGSFNSIAENRCTFDTLEWKNYPSAIKGGVLSENVIIDGILPQGRQLTDIMIPVWQRITLTESISLYDLNDNAISTYTNLNDNGLDVLYSFVGILTMEDEELVFAQGIKDVKFCYNKTLSPTVQYDTTTESYASQVTILDIKSSLVASNTLTVNVPFLYTVEESGSLSLPHFYITIQNDFQFNYGRKLKKNLLVVYEGTPPLLSMKEADTTVQKFTSVPTSPTLDDFLTYDSETHAYVTNMANRYSTAFRGKNEQILNEYPFNYTSIKANGQDIPVIGALGSGDKLWVNYRCNRKMTAHISFTGINNETIYIPLINLDSLPVREIVLSEYLQRNTGALLNQIGTALFSAFGDTIQSLTSAFSGKLNSTISNAYSAKTSIPKLALNIATNIYDKAKTPATLRIGDSNSMSSPLICDGAFFCKHQAYNPENYIVDYHNYGYECEYVGKIDELRRDLFDIDTGELTICAKISNECRQEIINAVANGMTRWHILDVNNQTGWERYDILIAMNRDVFNYPVSLIQS